MTFQFKLPVIATLLSLLPGLSLAQTGQMTGNLDGAALDFAVSDGVGGLPGLFFEVHEGRGYAELGVMASALEETVDGITGVVLFMDFETEPGLAIENLTADMVDYAEVMVIEEWQTGAENPAMVWIAGNERFASFEIDEISLQDESGVLAGRIASRRFCLHDMSSGEAQPLRRDGAMICKPGAVHFALATDDAMTPPPPQPMQMEVLGRATGMLGVDSYEWVTFQPQTGAPTVTLERLGGSDILRLQAHNPASANFLGADVLSVTLVGDTATGDIPSEGTISAELAFFTGEAGIFYSAQDGEGEMTAQIINFYAEDGQSEITMNLEGRVCRVEGFELVAGDCKAFEARIATQVVLAHDG
ncbi:MAG: hypothetical protein ACNA7Q_14450 [Rhodobacterales bacterium]